MKNINFKSLLFNVSEATVILLFGYLILKCSVAKMLISIALFVFVRENIGGAKHYKNPKKCAIWSFALIETLFLVIKTDLIIGISMSILAGVLMSKGGDIALFEYRNEDNKKKYREMKKYIEDCKDKKIMEEFEKRLKKIELTYKDRFKYSYCKIYELYFLKGSSFKDIKEELNMYDNHEVTEALDIIFMIFNTYMIEINEFDKLKENKELATKS